MSDIKTWSKTASENNSTAPDGFPEGMPASSLNNSSRELMASLKTWYEDAQWIDYNDTPTYVSTTSFTVEGDQTAIYLVNRRIRINDSTTLYGRITEVAYTSLTTVTVVLDSGDLSASISAVAVNIIDNDAFYVSPTVETEATTTAKGNVFLNKRITIANNSSDPDHNIDFGAGKFDFDDGTGQAVVSSLTKEFDSAWVAGDGNGGLLSGSISADTWYYIFAIYDDTNEIADIGADSSYASPTLPTGYTKKEYLGAFLTDSSSNIRTGFWKDGYFFFDTNIIEHSGTKNTTKETKTLTVPQGEECLAFGNARLSIANGSDSVRFYRIGATDDMSRAYTGSADSSDLTQGSDIQVITNSSGQIEWATNGSSRTIYLDLYGYKLFNK